MNELEKAQEMIINLQDVVEEKTRTIEEMTMRIQEHEENIKRYEERVEELQKSNKNYFDRLVKQDEKLQGGKDEIEEEIEIEGPINWSEFVE